MTEPSDQPVEYAVMMIDITKRFGSVLANDHLNISIKAGSIHAIVGENGAGKSTAMRILYGFHTADSGEILIDGIPRSIRSPADAIKLGIGMVHQHFMLVDVLTVTENIILGEEPRSGLAIDYKQARAKVKELSEQYGFKIDPDALLGDLSVGQQQRVEILKSLYRGTRILILDEPTAVLTPQEVDGLFSILRALKEQVGKTIVIITHKLSEVLALSDDITVMRDGRVVGTLPTAEATAKGLARMMVGRDVLLRAEKGEFQPGATVLSVRGLTVHNAAGHQVLSDVSFEVHKGEILAVAGVEGNGQTELIETLAGLKSTSPYQVQGEIELAGKRVERIDAGKLKRLGVAHIPEDRRRRGLLLPFDLAENSILGVQRNRPISGAVLLNESVITNRARRLVNEYDVRPANIRLPALALSGGNQQKLIVAREFDLEPKLLLVAQPTRGVDIGATEFIHKQLIDLRDKGAAILLVSAELDEVLSLGDRVIVLFEGRIAGEVDPRKITQQAIGLLMTGGRALGSEIGDESQRL
jgi:general nucleoside transport system ATP-binding protein